MAEVIERVTGVRYHPGHVWRLLHELGWSVQRSARRAAERDEEAIARWVTEDWPRVKKARDAAAKLTLLWDGLSSHRSRDMTAFIACCRGWLRVERLPAYAPELNPVEGLWGNVKGTELANRCADTIDEAMQAAYDGLDRVASDTDLCFALLRHTGVSL